MFLYSIPRRSVFPLSVSVNGVKSRTLPGRVRLPSLLIRAEFLYEPRAVAATSRGNSSSTTRTGPTARRDAVRKHNRKKLSAKRESASRVQCRPPWRSPVLRVLGRGARGRSPRAVASRAHFVTNGIQCVVYSRTRIDDSTLRLTFDASSGSVAAPPRLAPTFGKTGMLGPWPHSAARGNRVNSTRAGVG